MTLKSGFLLCPPNYTLVLVVLKKKNIAGSMDRIVSKYWFISRFIISFADDPRVLRKVY